MKPWQELSLPERIKLAQEIWDSIAAEQASVPITDAERAHLDEQLQAYEADPTAGASWEAVKARLMHSS